MKFITADQVYLGEPKSVTSGQITIPMTSFTPTVTNSTGLTSLVGNWGRNGDMMEIGISFAVPSQARSSTTSWVIPLPNGYVLDTQKLVDNGGTSQVGTVEIFGDLTGVASVYTPLDMCRASTAGILLAKRGTNRDLYDADFNGIGATKYINIKARIPILGWAATDIVTPESSNRAEVTANCASVAATYPNPATIASITLTSGKWLVHGYDSGYNSVLGPSGSSSAIGSDLYDGSSIISRGDLVSLSSGTPIAGDATYASLINDAIVDVPVGTTKTISFRIRCDSVSGTPTGATAVSRGFGKLFAVPYNTQGQQSFYLTGPVKGGNSGNAIPAGFMNEVKIAAYTKVFSSTVAGWYNIPADSSNIVLDTGQWEVRTLYGFPMGAAFAGNYLTIACSSNADSAASFLNSQRGTPVLGTTTGGGASFERTDYVTGSGQTFYPKIYITATSTGTVTAAVFARRLD
jgi:hypothetical protein